MSTISRSSLTPLGWIAYMLFGPTCLHGEFVSLLLSAPWPRVISLRRWTFHANGPTAPPFPRSTPFW